MRFSLRKFCWTIWQENHFHVLEDDEEKDHRWWMSTSRCVSKYILFSDSLFFSWHFPCHCYSSRLVVVVVYLAMRQAHITTGFLIIIDRYFYQKRKKKGKENRLFLGTRKYVSIEKNFSSSLHIARTFFVLLNVCIGREQKWPFFVSLSDIFSAYMFFRIIKHLYLFLQQRYKELKKKRKRRRKRERERGS